MAITLAQAKVGMADKVDQMIIDEFRRGSMLLDSLIFDNAVSPGTGGSTLGYTYIRLKTPSMAQFRALNTDYTPQEAVREPATAMLKIFGGNFNLDRVIIDTAGAVNELQFQMQEQIRGAINLFHNTVINGDSALRPLEFDGLDVMLTGSNTEYNTTTAIDLSDDAAMSANYDAFLDGMNEFVSELEDRPTMFLANSKLITKIKNVARRAGYYERIEDAFGRSVDAWDGIPLVDMRYFWNGTTTVPCVPIDTDGETSLFAVNIAIDGFHGVSPVGNNIIKTALPDLTAPGVMKLGDVEAVMAVVLKNTRKAGVFRKIQVEA